ncbi:MAG: methionyl-tRNA formyltransferase [Spirochaetes bacterium]|nr:methionyl-tRNA formyltransferase [Spirochaetota bacterium]
MKIGFFGTPEIAAFYFKALIQEHEVVFAVTGEDKPKGRHGSPAFSDVKKIAIEKNIPVFQPTELADDSLLRQIAGKNADIFVVVAYGRILPAKVYKMSPLRTINVHPSLLPKYRGAAPIQWALINGEPETGITIQYINEKLDSGDILLQKKIPLNIEMTSADLTAIVLPEGLALLLEALNQLAAGNANPIKQNEAEATFCGKIGRETACIDWKKNSEKIHNLVRGLNPKPAAWTEFNGKNIKIYKTKLLTADSIDAIKENISMELKPGYLAGYKKRLFVCTGNGFLEILTLQPETKKTMEGSSFMNGYRLSAGDSFGTL